MKSFQMVSHAGRVAGVGLDRHVAGDADRIVLVQLLKVVPDKTSFLSLGSGCLILYNKSILWKDKMKHSKDLNKDTLNKGTNYRILLKDWDILYDPFTDHI